MAKSRSAQPDSWVELKKILLSGAASFFVTCFCCFVLFFFVLRQVFLLVALWAILLFGGSLGHLVFVDGGSLGHVVALCPVMSFFQRSDGVCGFLGPFLLGWPTK